MFCLYKLAFVLLSTNVSICENCLDILCQNGIHRDLSHSTEGFYVVVVVVFNLRTFHLVAWLSGKN